MLNLGVSVTLGFNLCSFDNAKELQVNIPLLPIFTAKGLLRTVSP